MHYSLYLTLLNIAFTHASVLPRAEQAPSWDGPFQDVPPNGLPDNTFHDPNWVDPYPELNQHPSENVEPPLEYQPRPFDIPFGLLTSGKLNFFKKSQLNDPTRATESGDSRPGKHDSAKNSACGIPDAAYATSKVAIHPYWLKYAPEWLGLSRYCMQDVCISVWNDTGAAVTKGKDGLNDVELKVTDICSTDPDDPSYCESPADIMMDRVKAQLLFNATLFGEPDKEKENAALKHGAQYPNKVWWFFSKCWDDGLLQGPYDNKKNWFATPHLPNNLPWHGRAMQQQQKNNCGSEKGSYSKQTYKGEKLPCYKYGALKQDHERPALRFNVEEYWKKGDKEPEWCPVAGGKGHAKPKNDCPLEDKDDTISTAGNLETE